MRLLRLLFTLLLLGFFALPARAQTPDAAAYEVTDVAADVTADSGVHAREQAIAQAQRTALGQLFQRLGADSNLAANLGSDDIATLVQSFEVQNERTSALRYIGTFTVQFRPNAIKTYLGGHNVSYSDARSKPVVVLPVTVNGGHPVLWEEVTKWRTAWEAGASTSGLVPIVVPQGGLDDISVVSTEEAVGGKADALKALVDKYQAGSALVAILDGDPTKAGSPLTVELWRYGPDGRSLANTSLVFSAPTDKGTLDALMTQGVKQARDNLETDWKREAKNPSAVAGEAGNENLPTVHLPMTVPVQSLAEWEQIHRRLEQIPIITRADVIVLARGMTSIEVEFRGDIPELQSALAGQNLSLTQNKVNGAWTLQPVTAGNQL